MSRTHRYTLSTEWTGNRGTGTTSYAAYARDHVVTASGKPDLLGSADRSFRGDVARWNPEELLVASLSACHMLVYLHQAAISGVVVTAYADQPVGEMDEDDDDGGRFRRVLLRPTVTVTEASMIEPAARLHSVAHAKCFIANSVNFAVEHDGIVVVDSRSTESVVDDPG